MNDLISASRSTRVLVTGAAGFIGQRVVSALLDRGFSQVRCLVRPSSQLSRLRQVIDSHPAGAGLELVTGDLLSRADCGRIADGVEVIYHLAAGVEKSFAGAFMNSALATRNLLEAFRDRGRWRRFVNVSSFAAYSNLRIPRGALLDESCPIERHSQERGDAYGFGKIKQDDLVIEFCARTNLPYVILRPGSVFGPGKAALTGRVGIDTFGIFLHLGGRNRIPLTYVDNCAEAIVLAGLAAGVDGEVFNVVDDDLPTSRDLLKAYQSRRRMKALPVPYWLTKLMCTVWEAYSRTSKGQLPPVFNRRRCVAEWGGNSYSNRRLKERLGWKPRVPMDEALQAYLAQFDQVARHA